MNAILRISDDDGYLAVVDPDAYDAYIGPDWTFHELEQRVLREMREHHLLVWGSGGEGEWLVLVSSEPVAVTDEDSVVGRIDVAAGRLLVTSFSSLSMAAQFDDVHLPESHEGAQIVHVPVGSYSCRVIRFRSPTRVAGSIEPVHYVLELSVSTEHAASWREIPWGAA